MAVKDLPAKTPVCYWRPGSHVSVDASAAYSEFQAIKEANLGSLTPELVVSRAEGGDSRLHDAFTWDDSLAAEAHRLQQAREIINSIRIEDDVDGTEYAFMSIADKGGTAYRTLGEIKSSPDLFSKLCQLLF